MIYLASYDITEDRLRTKLAKRLEAAGLERIQYSVFAGPLTAGLLQQLKNEISALLAKSNFQTDRCLMLPITRRMLEAQIHWGKPLDVDYICGDQQVLIL